MKNINLLASFLLLLLISGCGRPPEPKNQALEKGHEEPAKVELIFTPGTLAQESIISTDYVVAGFEPEAGVEDVIYVGEYQSLPDPKNPNGRIQKLVVTKGEIINLSKGKWYRLRAKFYNAAGAPITWQYLTPDQQMMHQFFFRTYEGFNEDIGRYEKQNWEIVDYKYGDRDDDRDRLLPFPVGFLGYFYIKPDVSLEQFVERVTLAHIAPPASKLNAEGVPHRFDRPARRLMGVTDIDVRVNIKINH